MHVATSSYLSSIQTRSSPLLLTNTTFRPCRVTLSRRSDSVKWKIWLWLSVTSLTQVPLKGSQNCKVFVIAAGCYCWGNRTKVMVILLAYLGVRRKSLRARRRIRRRKLRRRRRRIRRKRRRRRRKRRRRLRRRRRRRRKRRRRRRRRPIRRRGRRKWLASCKGVIDFSERYIAYVHTRDDGSWCTVKNIEFLTSTGRQLYIYQSLSLTSFFNTVRFKSSLCFFFLNYNCTSLKRLRDFVIYFISGNLPARSH